LLIGASSSAYPNPADDQTRIKLFLNRVEGVQVAVTIYDFVGKKIRTINIPVINAVPYEIAWDLTSSSGSKLGRGTYFARVVATDGSSRTEKVIKIAVK
ncbi:MAG TPA: T9SS type A sorting domain-containing protein, partial [Candidatus Syntrophosphaera sp.]|nr:T9SS type A sorting domain-containing protein [Candidatus Syntrophosphaera sp.]